MGMHDDGIYTATSHFSGDNGTPDAPRGESTSHHTSQAAALDALHHTLQTAQDRGTRYVAVNVMREDTPQRQQVFAARKSQISQVLEQLSQSRSAYSRAWDALKDHAHDVVAELRNPESVVHRPLSPELRDVAWSAQNIYDAGLSAPSSDLGERVITQHEALEDHLAREVDRAKDRARDAGHTEAQIEAAVGTDPDLDMRSLRQQSAGLIRTVRDLAADPSLTPSQAHTLLAAADRAEDTVAELAAHNGIPPVGNVVGTAMGGRTNAVTTAAQLAATDYPIAATSAVTAPSAHPPARRVTTTNALGSVDQER
ncbi:MAG: hypothetical protein WAW17_18265 [Rhodococcus sp. (in: high G+C Gram-positive bacteria)]|uniref:hypothetical protein n=1 Tax=Rhodococcus sp. TaxID=1831 RepID=UPI003BB0DF74